MYFQLPFNLKEIPAFRRKCNHLSSNEQSPVTFIGWYEGRSLRSDKLVGCWGKTDIQMNSAHSLNIGSKVGDLVNRSASRQ